MNPDGRSQLHHHIGRYRIVASLGQGGMGTIWLAVAGGLGEFRKLLVIKELRQDLTRNHRFVEMFLDEAKLAARLTHPNVVHTLEAGQDGERYFLSMEFLDGQPLTEVMQRATTEPRIALPVRLRIVCDVLAGLHHAHELRDYDGTDLHIVHRDISPQNVFVTYDGQVKVVDFGIAKAADAGNVTQPGVFKGKLSYAAPEQLAGQPVDRRADVFAVGVLLWELCTLKRFAKGKPTQAAVDARLRGMEPRLAAVDPEADELLCEISDRALAVDPAQRFASAEEFRLALEQYLLVSGERVDTKAVAAVMHGVFAAERTAMHRMIDVRLKESEFSESVVRNLRPAPTELLGEDDPTKIGDLSELVESSRNARIDDLDGAGATGGGAEFARALRGGQARWGAAAALGALLAVIVFAIIREPGPPTPTTAVPPDPNGASAPSAEPQAASPAAAAEPIAPPAAVVQVPVPPAAPVRVPEPPKPAAGTAGPDSVAELRSARGGVRPAARRVAERREGASVKGREPSEPDVTASEPELGLELDDKAERAAAPARERAASMSLAKSSDDGVELGADLRQVPRAERRKLDVEDPFQ